MANPPVGLVTKVDVSGITGFVSEAKTRNITMKGLRAGIKLLVPAARANAPKATGTLKRAQGYRVAKGRRGKTISFAVQGAKKKYESKVGKVVHKPMKYDHLVQGGVRPHRLGKGEKLDRVRVTRSSENFVPGTAQTAGGMHPGVKPNPYRRRAFDSTKDEMCRTIAREMVKEFERVVAKQAVKVQA